MKITETSNLSSQSTPSNLYREAGRRSHVVLIVLFLIYMSDYIDRYALTSMIEFIKRDWHITDAQAGSLVSVIYLFITVFTIPASILIDRWSRRKMISMMVFFWSLATMACAFTKNYVQLLVARAFVGIGESGYAPGGSAMLAAAYPEERRARVMGIWNASIPLGVGVGLFAGGQIARRWGWHHALGVVAVPGMFLALAAWFLPDYRTVRAEARTGDSPGNAKAFVAKAASIMRAPSLVLTYLGFAMNVAASTALMTWLPAYFERTGLAAPGKGGTYTIPIFGIVLLGAPLGGFLSDAWYQRRKESRLVFPALTSLAASLLLFIGLLQTGSGFQLPFLIVQGIFATCYIAPAAAVTQDLVHPGLRAFSYGMCVIVQHIFGDIWSPWLVGMASDRLGLSTAVLFIPILGVLAAACFFAGSRFYVRDLSRVERLELVAE